MATTAREEGAHGSYVKPGESFERDTTYIEDRIVSEDVGALPEPPASKVGSVGYGLSKGAQAWPVEPGRYHLVAARACPWANRTLIVRRLLGLEDVISIGLPGPCLLYTSDAADE